MTEARHRATAGVLKVVLAYALFAGLWILLSDRAIGLLFSDRATLLNVSMIKGWVFVAVTSALLFALMRRMTLALVEAHGRELALEREREQPPAMLTAIAEASTDAIFAKDAEGRYVLLNRAAAEAIGKPAADVLGRDDRAVLPHALAERVMGHDRRVSASGQAETDEEALQTPDGERVFLATRGPLRGADGRVFGTYGISRDITERKRAQESLQQLADDLSATLQAIPDLMFELDAQGRYVKVKALNESLLAAPSDRLLGQTIHEVLTPEAATVVSQALAAAGRTGTDFGRTMTVPLPTGDRHFELSVSRKPALAGQGDRFIVLSRDVTGRQAAEAELRQRNLELERFNRAATERELRMVALKREVNELARAAGQPPRYDTAFADAAGAPAATA